MPSKSMMNMDMEKKQNIGTDQLHSPLEIPRPSIGVRTAALADVGVVCEAVERL